ncbi:MAG: hypothetical protein QNJ75_08295 [Acidimicrobiia bacterium]|nr:hypothetical protein [Acidimicrobiia bacterium]
MSQVTPQSDPSPGRGLPLSAATALVLAVVLSLGVFWLTTSGESPVGVDLNLSPGDAAALVGNDGQVPVTTRAPAPPADDGMSAMEEPGILAAPPTTVAPAASRTGAGGEDSMSSAFSVLAMASEITNMGPTEVGFVTNFPEVAYEWQRVEITLDGPFDVIWLGELNGNLVSVGNVWSIESEGAEGHRVVTAESPNGLDWQVAGELDLPNGTWVSRVVSDGERIYVLADSWNEADGTNTTLLYSSDDGVVWDERRLDLRAGSDEHLHVQNAAAGPAGLAIAVSFDSYPEQEPSLLDFGDVQLELDHRSGTYKLFDAASGDELLSGSLDDIYGSSADGQTIYHPETGELLTTVPWEIWENAFNRFYEGRGVGSPLPLPISSVEPEDPPVISIEHDGYVIVIDEYAYEFWVADAESGEQIASGSMEFVYQSPPPQFVDPDSGEVLLSVTWDEWYRAEEESYRLLGTYHYEYTSRTELLTSTDGVSWQSTEIPARQGAHVSSLVPTESGFIAMVNTYGEFGDQRSVWSLRDGAWTSTEAESADLWLHQVAMAQTGFFAVGDGSGGPALWSSPDGVSWVSEFAIVPQDDGSYVSLSAVAADESGTVGALARREKWNEYEPLVIEKDGYTLRFEEADIALRVVDAAGVDVLVLDWYSFEEDAFSDVATWDDGVTYINLDNGDVIAIPDEEAYAAIETRWEDQGAMGLSVFLKDGATWSEAIVEVEGGMSGGNRLLMIDGRIIIGGSYWQGGEELYRSEVVETGSFVVIVGTPIGG